MNRETGMLDSSDRLVVVDRSRRRTIIIVAAALIGAVAILIAVFGLNGSSTPEAAGGAEGAAAGRRGQIPTVSVIVPGKTSVARVITASGALAARRDEPVGVAGEGGRVESVRVDAGSWVNAGQVLAVIDRSVQVQEASQLAAQVAAARADAALAQNELERSQALSGRGFVSKADLDRKRAARDAASARVRVAEAQLGASRARLGRLNVVAPSSGLILQRNVEVGQIVSAGSGALFRIARGGEMEMRADMAQQDLAAVHVGMPATVRPIGSDRAFAGTVWQVAPIIDPQSRQGSVRISLPYNQALRPGGFAEAKITAGGTTAPLLPQSAVLSDEKGNYVYLVNAKDEAERRDIQIGEVGDQGVTIAQGLNGTERVVLSAGPFLNPGQKVAPKRQAAAPAAN